LSFKLSVYEWNAGSDPWRNKIWRNKIWRNKIWRNKIWRNKESKYVSNTSRMCLGSSETPDGNSLAGVRQRIDNRSIAAEISEFE
jgi:hypothetical protein